MQAGIYDLGFSSRNNSSRSGPAYEVADWIPMLAEKVGLSLTQGFEKRELSDEDIVLILHTLWSRAEHIQCTPDAQILHHLRPVQASVSAYRTGYESDSRQRFQGRLHSIDQLLSEKPLDHDYVPLHWKSSVLDAKIVPCSYRSFWKLWNRTLYVAGLRNDDNIRPYALRVGAGGRLDGSLTRALSNYIMSHTTEVFERSYQARHLTANLMRIAFDSRAGDNGGMIRSLRSAFSRRDPEAPIYVSTDELAAFEERKDIQTLRQLHKETFKKEPHKATAIKNQIRYLLDCLEKLKLQEIRRKYFDTVDNLRGRHESTEHLDPQLTENPRSAREVPSFQRAVLIGKFMRENASVVTLGESMIAYLEEWPTKLYPHVSKPPPPKSANVMDMR
ncbi:hypothetical protein G3M48_008066 [Beauveria asiatica]|uniref:Uncharacterized protein n=1 Tax=Beauveria asiatica TaxID=1069075 RepID=A0AAW0RLP3_9HYPO